MKTGNLLHLLKYLADIKIRCPGSVYNASIHVNVNVDKFEEPEKNCCADVFYKNGFDFEKVKEISSDDPSFEIIFIYEEPYNLLGFEETGIKYIKHYTRIYKWELHKYSKKYYEKLKLIDPKKLTGEQLTDFELYKQLEAIDSEVREQYLNPIIEKMVKDPKQKHIEELKELLV